jgi:hypothetical protein
MFIYCLNEDLKFKFSVVGTVLKLTGAKSRRIKMNERNEVRTLFLKLISKLLSSYIAANRLNVNTHNRIILLVC